MTTPNTTPERVSIRRNLGHMMTSQVVTWILATVIAVVVPRHVGPEAIGQLRVATSLWLIGAILVDLGTSRLQQLEASRRGRAALADTGLILIVRTVSFLVTCGLVVAYAAGVVGTPQVVLLAAIISVSTLLTTWSEALSAGFIGLERMSAPAIAVALGKFVNVALVLVVVALDGTVVEIAWMGVIAAAISAAYLLRRFRALASLDFRSCTKAGARRIVRGSVPFMLAAGALVLYQQIDILVISFVADDDAVGWYGTADALFGSLLFPATILMATVFPSLGRLWSGDRPAFEHLVSRTWSLLALAAVPIGLGTALVAPSFAPMLFGEDFRETGTVLAVLGPVLVLTFGTILVGTVALATDRSGLWVGVMLTAAALTIPLDLVLVPWADERFDNAAVGGAVAYLVTETFQLTVGLIVVAPFLVNSAMLWRLTRTLIAGAAMSAAVWPVRDHPIVLPVVVGAAVYTMAVYVLRVLTPDERELISSMSARVGLRSRRTAEEEANQ